MTPKQYAELLEYIYENNSWANLYGVIEENNRVAVKYVDLTSVFDTRDCKIWIISLRGCVGHNVEKHEKTFVINDQKDLDKLYEWLDKDRCVM